jgi:thiol-disulfide isomerase/thioredoxin
VNDQDRARVRRTAARAALLVLGLLSCAAAGFLFHWMTRERATLYAESAATPRESLPAEAPATPAPQRAIPERVPDLSLPGPDGKSHRLSEWKGQPLLINFWATWCEPCRREIPLLKALRHERHGEGLQVVGIAVDYPAAVRTYASERGIDYPLLVGEQGGLAAVSAFGMDTVLPFSVFADATGRVVALKVGELHRDEAEFILDRLSEVDRGSLSLPAARAAISDGIARLSAARAGSAAH